MIENIRLLGIVLFGLAVVNVGAALLLGGIVGLGLAACNVVWAALLAFAIREDI